MDPVLKYCVENNILRATDFEPILYTLTNDTMVPVKENENNITTDKKRYRIYPQKSCIADCMLLPVYF
jgi:hypothetical protein